MVLQGLGRVLVLNAGSSSLKFKLFDLAPALASTVGGMIDRIGDKANSALIAKKSDSNGTTKFKDQVPIDDHVVAMKTVMDFLSKNVSSNILKEVVAVGHRVVHGLDIHSAAQLTEAAIDAAAPECSDAQHWLTH